MKTLNINWITLWVLNELVCQRLPLGRLIYYPEAESWSHWSFPARAALRGGQEGRHEAICACLEQGWIRAYPDSWASDRRFGPPPSVSPDQLKLSDPGSLERTEVVLTLEGHAKWEAEFEPDWERYWQVDVSSPDDENSRERILDVLYAGNEILDDLIRWLPTYWGLDTNAGLKETSCHTRFQHQATLWKVLPWVKSITLEGQDGSGEFKATVEKTMRPPWSDDDQFPEARKRIEQYTNARTEAMNAAVSTLHRFSKRWECADASSPLSRDAIPRLIIR